MLMSVAASLQVALLLGYKVTQVVRPMSEAIGKARAQSAHNGELFRRWVDFIARSLLTTTGEFQHWLYQ